LRAGAGGGKARQGDRAAIAAGSKRRRAAHDADGALLIVMLPLLLLVMLMPVAPALLSVRSPEAAGACVIVSVPGEFRPVTEINLPGCSLVDRAAVGDRSRHGLVICSGVPLVVFVVLAENAIVPTRHRRSRFLVRR